MKHEGPTNITSTSRTCGLCKFHRQHMIRSGENPWYKHFCGHPASSQGVKYSSFLFPDEHGREIGDTDNTPDWCPVVSERLSRKDEPQRGSDSDPDPNLAAGDGLKKVASLCGGITVTSGDKTVHYDGDGVPRMSTPAMSNEERSYREGWNAGIMAVVEALKSREKAFRSKFLADGVVNDVLRMKTGGE